jgi:hypothetical protein
VNLYYKKPVPPIGYYNPKYPEAIGSRLEDSLKFSYKYVFDSHNKERNTTDQLINGDKYLVHHGKIPQVYNTNEQNKVKLSMPSAAF